MIQLFLLMAIVGIITYVSVMLAIGLVGMASSKGSQKAQKEIKKQINNQTNKVKKKINEKKYPQLRVAEILYAVRKEYKRMTRHIRTSDKLNEDLKNIVTKVLLEYNRPEVKEFLLDNEVVLAYLLTTISENESVMTRDDSKILDKLTEILTIFAEDFQKTIIEKDAREEEEKMEKEKREQKELAKKTEERVGEEMDRILLIKKVEKELKEIKRL